MSLFEKINVITERKYLPNDPSPKKSPIKRVFGKIFSNKAKDIRKAPGDPLMGPPGLDYNDPNDLPSNKLGKPTYKNIPKGSLPKPSKPKAPIQLPPAKTSKTVKQSDVSKQAKEFTKDINKANVKRQETVAKRKYFRGRKAERLPGRSGEKPTGSIARGTYKSSPTGQRAYDYEKMKIDARDQQKSLDKLDRKLAKDTKLQKALKKKGITQKPSEIIKDAGKDFDKRLRSGDPKAKEQLNRVVSKDVAKKTPAQIDADVDKIVKVQKARGRVPFRNPKTGQVYFADPTGIEQTAKAQKQKSKPGLLNKVRRRIFPGDKSGKYQAAKSDLDTKKLLKKAGASGDVSDKAGPEIRKKVEAIRKERADKLGTPDPFSKDAKPLKSTKFKDLFKGTKKGGISPALKGTKDPKKAAFNIDLSKDPFKTSSDTPLNPSYPERKVPTSTTSSKKPVYNARAQVIKNIRAMNQRLDKPLSKVQQRKQAIERSKEYTAKQLRQIRMQREYGGGLSGTIGPPTGTPTVKKVKASSGAKIEFPSGSPEMGGESKKFASRNRTPAPQPYRNKGVGIEKTGETKVDKAQRKAISKTRKQLKDIKGKLLKQREKVRSLPGNELGRKNTKLLRQINRGITGIESQEVGYKQAAKGFGNPNAPTVYNKKFAELQKDLAKKGKITQIKPEKTDKVIDLFGKSKSGNYRSGSQSVFPNRLTNPDGRVTGTDLFRQNTIKGAGSSKITGSKTGSEIFKQNIIKGAKGPTSMKNVKLGNKAFMKKMLKNTAKAAVKAGPVGRGVAAAAAVAAGLYGLDRIKKRFTGGGAGKKGVPSMKSSPLMYKQGVKDDQGRDIGGQKKYFKLRDVKTNYFTPSDLKNATFDNKADDKLRTRIKNTPNKK